jgi:hypothetical protein
MVELTIKQLLIIKDQLRWQYIQTLVKIFTRFITLFIHFIKLKDKIISKYKLIT